MQECTIFFFFSYVDLRQKTERQHCIKIPKVHAYATGVHISSAAIIMTNEYALKLP
mgnify:CR=1 FL=1